MKPIKRIGVLTSGGDAPGMNAAVRAVVRTAINCGIECVGIRRGWQGLINSDFVQLTSISVGHILARGGTILYTARSEDFMTENGRKKAVSTCRMLGLDAIVAIGGDGTFRGALELSRLGIPVVGVPATIDNDVGCTNYTIGFDSACNTAIECGAGIPHGFRARRGPQDSGFPSGGQYTFHDRGGRRRGQRGGDRENDL